MDSANEIPTEINKLINQFVPRDRDCKSPTAEIIMKRIIDLCCDAEDSRLFFAEFHFKYLDLWNVPHPRKCELFYDDDDDDDG